MLKKTNLWRGFALVCALLTAVSMMAGSILETYRTSVDAFFGTRSTITVTEASDNEEDAWNYQSELQTAQQAYEGFRDFAIRASQETFALLKNDNDALPLSSDAKITMLGIRSYAPVYGNNGGSVPDGKSTVQIFDAFTERGFRLNPETLAAYEAFFADKSWTTPQFGGGILPSYAEVTSYSDPCELTMDELTALNPNFTSAYSEYSDAAIVVVGRVGGEGGNGYYPGEAGLAEGVSTVTGNILSLSDEEMTMVEEAKANFDKVNSHLTESEGIYTGYRYYETRYADIVLGNGGANASAGTYANPDGTVAETDGVWAYDNEVVYPFGYGLSYTSFEQTLDQVVVAGNKETATVTVTTPNTGTVAGKAVVRR